MIDILSIEQNNIQFVKILVENCLPLLSLGIGAMLLWVFPIKRGAIIYAACIGVIALVFSYMSIPKEILSNEFGFEWTQWNLSLTKILILATLFGFGLFLLEQYSKSKSNPMESVDVEGVGLILLGLLFSILTVIGRNYLLVFTGIEGSALLFYILLAWRKGEKNAESAIKYSLFGATASCLSLLGLSWIYGATGTLAYTPQMQDIYIWLHLAGIVLFLGIFLFKFSLYPWQWVKPDVFAGGPVSILFLISVWPFVSGLGALSVLFQHWSQYLNTDIVRIFVLLLCIVNIIGGSWAAARQVRIRRILAYGSIVQGAVFWGMSVLPSSSMDRIVFYVVVYVLYQGGVFLFLYVQEKTTGLDTLESMQGTGKSAPLYFTGVLFILLAAAGFPLTVTFIAKWQILLEFISSDLVLLKIIGCVWILHIPLSFYFYLKILLRMAEKSNSIHPIKIPQMRWQWILFLYGAGMVLSLFFPHFVRIV